MQPTPLTIEVPDIGVVSALWRTPPGFKATFVLAHGAGAGMTHPSMAAIADGLAERGVATLRYQFPYMDKGGRRPDTPAIAQAAVRAAVAAALDRAGATPLFAGGRSFGGRMTSGAQAAAAMPGVRGLIFFAFPLHLAGKPAVARAAHLRDIDIPMLFLSGSNDALAQRDLLKETVADLKDRATLGLIAEADHSFHVPKKSGRSDQEVLAAAIETAVEWMAEIS